jgi:hypothetical protein
MTNERRRDALNKARGKALLYAQAADDWHAEGDSLNIQISCQMATMWARVAEAMKDGDPVHDGPDGLPDSPVLSTEHGVITR